MVKEGKELYVCVCGEEVQVGALSRVWPIRDSWYHLGSTEEQQSADQ